MSLYQAKAQLSHLVDCVARGNEIVITRYGRPVARLVSIGSPRTPRRLGALRGKIQIADDFDAPLPKALLSLFDGDRR